MRNLLKFICHCEERHGNLIKLNEITTQTNFALNDRVSRLVGGGALSTKLLSKEVSMLFRKFNDNNL